MVEQHPANVAGRSLLTKLLDDVTIETFQRGTYAEFAIKGVVRDGVFIEAMAVTEKSHRLPKMNPTA